MIYDPIEIVDACLETAETPQEARTNLIRAFESAFADFFYRDKERVREIREFEAELSRIESGVNAVKVGLHRMQMEIRRV